MADLEKELLHRLLKSHFRVGDQEERFYVGELPSDFPVQLPAGSRLIGSMTQSTQNIPARSRTFFGHNFARVLLDSVLSVPEFIAQMRAGLNGQWEDAEWPHMMSTGFLPAEAQDSVHVYSPTLKKSLHVEAFEAGGVTRVDIALNSQSDENRDQLRQHLITQTPQIAVRVPAGTTVYPGGSGGSGESWHCEAVIAGPLSAAELLESFSPQLLVKGYQPLTRGQTGALLAASWATESNDMVLITLVSGDQGYNANMVTVKGQPTNEGGRVGISIVSSGT
jgi:hypothetical protein